MKGWTIPVVVILVMFAGHVSRRLLFGAATASARRRVGLLRAYGADGGDGVAPATLAKVSGWRPARFVQALAEAGVSGDPVRWWRSWVALVTVAVGSAGLAAGGAAATSAAILTVAVPLACLFGARHRGDERIEAALPEVLETTAAALRSGSSLHGALAAAARLSGPLAPDLRLLVDAVNRGAPLTSELDRWALRRPLPGVRLAAAALAMGVEAGGARARAVDGIADTLRDRAAMTSEVAAQSAQARSSVVVMSAVPVVVAMTAAATDAGTAEFLFRTPAGVLCMVCGLALDGVAVLWMTRLVRRASHIPVTAT